ncbi:hypothetical protein EVAR_90250_1, partial [Eumeta japonica]
MVNCNNLANNRLPTVLNSWAQQAPRDLQTEDKLQYNFFPVTSGSIQFRVRAPNDAHIALTTGPGKTQYSDIHRRLGQHKSVIEGTAPNRQGRDRNSERSERGEFRGFWCALGRRRGVGRPRNGAPFISWQDPDPFPVSFMSFCTGAPPALKVEAPKLIGGCTHCRWARIQYPGQDRIPVPAGHERHAGARVPRAPRLSRVPDARARRRRPVYEIMIGGWQNTVTAPTPGIADPNEFKKFLIQWNNGRLLVRDGATGQTFMEWTDPRRSPSHASAHGLGARGQWRIKHWRSPPTRSRVECPRLGPSAPPAALYAAPPGYPNAQPSGYRVFHLPATAPPGNAVWVDSSNGQ